MANLITDLTVFNAPSANDPDGTLKDQEYSAPGVVSVVGSRGFGRFITDLFSPFHKWIREFGGVLNGNTDEQLDSQFVDFSERKIRFEADANQLFNWAKRQVTGVAQRINVCIFHPDLNTWYAVDQTNLYWYSGDGAWVIRDTLPSIPSTHKVAAITPTKAVFGLAAANLWYVVNSTAVPTVDAGLAMSTVFSLASKYEEGGSDEFLAAGGSSGKIEFSTTGPGGSWTLPTTPPAIATTIQEICWLGATSFMAIGLDGSIFLSTDDCDTWSTVNDITDFTTGYGLDCERTTGRIVACGDTAAGDPIQYSDDNGTTWTPAIIEGLVGSSRNATNVKYLGENIWVCCGNLGIGRFIEGGTVTQDFPFCISFDNGANWVRPEYENVNAGDAGLAIGFDGNKAQIGILSSDGQVLGSLSKRYKTPVLF